MNNTPTLTRVPDSGAYRLGEHPEERLERYTCFIRYSYGEGAGDYSIEEIDVDALSFDHAHDVCTAALAEDYEPGGVLVNTLHRPRGVMYL